MSVVTGQVDWEADEAAGLGLAFAWASLTGDSPSSVFARILARLPVRGKTIALIRCWDLQMLLSRLDADDRVSVAPAYRPWLPLHDRLRWEA